MKNWLSFAVLSVVLFGESGASNAVADSDEIKLSAPQDQKEKNMYNFGSLIRGEKGEKAPIDISKAFGKKSDQENADVLKVEKKSTAQNEKEINSEEGTDSHSNEKRFIPNKDDLFRSANHILKDFPLNKLDKQSGIIETDEAIVPDFNKEFTYSIKVQVFEGGKLEVKIFSEKDKKENLTGYGKALEARILKAAEKK